MMYIPNQLIGAPVNTQVTMECTTEASPKVIKNYNVDTLPHQSDLSQLGLFSHHFILFNKMQKSFLA